jgi:thermitase
MKIRRINFILAILLLLFLWPANAFAAPPGVGGTDENFSPDEILVKFRAGTTPAEAAQIHGQFGSHVKEVIPGIGVEVVTVPNGKALEKAKGYAAHGKVLYAEPDYQAEAVGTPNDPWFSNQWGMTKIQAPEAWSITTGNAAIKIAILDTGIEPGHPDLAGKILDAVNFTSSNTTADVDGHGTHVAGIAAANTNNAMGVAGLGYNSSLLNVKVLGDDGNGAYSWIAKGIIWAADHGAQVINLSLGGTSASLTLEDAVNYAWSKGALVVATAGNNANTTPFYPAYYTNAIAVAGTDSLDRLAGWSDYGDWVDVAAPGVNIVSTIINSGYGYKSGTSMAAPFVSGLAALAFAVVTDTNGNGLLNDEVRTDIQNNADDIGVSGIGRGRINAYKAIQAASTPPPPDTQAPTVTVGAPNGGEKWKVGCQYNITWTAADNVGVTGIDISYSTDNGTTYPNTIATSITNYGTYSWTIPNTISTTCKVKITAHDAASNVGEDASNAAFEICYNLRGDANYDGVVNSLDITQVERIIQGLVLTAADADANADGVVNALDITTVEKIIAGP